MTGQAFSEGEIAFLTDTLNLSELQKIAEKTDVGISVKESVLSVASGESVFDRSFFSDLWSRVKDGFISRTTKLLPVFLLPGLILAVCTHLSSGQHETMKLIGGISCAVAFLSTVKEVFLDANELFSLAVSVSEASLPVLTSLTALSGQSAAAATLTPSATLAGEMIVEVLQKWGLRLCGASCAVSAVDAVSGRFRLNGVMTLMKSVLQVGCGILLAMFVGILKVQGLLSSNFDSAAMKTAQFAFDKMIPVIGGRLADSMDVTLSSIMLVRGAAGVTGLCVLIRRCAVPLLRIWGTMLAARCAGAILQPMGNGGFSAIAAQFADVLRMLLILCLTAVTITIVLLGAAIRAGGGIGI